MPSVGMRRTTRVFGVVKGVDGARVLRSGRRLFPGSGDAKFRRANDGDEWLHTMIKSTTNSNKNNHNNSSVKCKENGWTRHCKLKQETPRLNNGVVPKGVKCESCLPSTTTQTNKFGIVYTRKRRRADGEKLENLDSRKFGIQFSRRQRRRKQFDIHPPRLVVAVDGFCSVGGLTSFLLLVFGYMRKGTLRLSQLASFLSAEPVRNAFASSGIRFLQGSTDGNTRICKIFGVSCTVPIFSLGFSAVPSCFLYMHLRLHFIVKSLSVVPVNTTLDEDSSDESDEEQSIAHVKADSLLEISNSENKVVLHPSVRTSKLAGRHSQYRNGLNSRGIQKRRSSLRRKKARNHSMIGMHKANGALVSDLVSSRKNGIPFSSVVSKNKLRSMVQSSAVSNLKMESPAVVEETRAMDTSSCSANGHHAKKAPLIPKPVLRKRRSFRWQVSQFGRGKQPSLLQAMAAEHDALEEQNAMRRVEAAKASAKLSLEAAIVKRRHAQMLMVNADLAIYKATMALRIALISAPYGLV